MRYDGGAHYYDAIITGETPQGFEVKYKDGDCEINVAAVSHPPPPRDRRQTPTIRRVATAAARPRISAREQEALDRALALSLAVPARRASLKATASLSGSPSRQPAAVAGARPKPQKPARKGPKIAVCRPVLAKGALFGVAPPPPRAAALAATRALYMDGGFQLPRDEPPSGKRGALEARRRVSLGQPRARVNIDLRIREAAARSRLGRLRGRGLRDLGEPRPHARARQHARFGVRLEVRQRKQATFFVGDGPPRAGGPPSAGNKRRKPGRENGPAKPRPKKVVQPRSNDESWVSESEESDESDESITSTSATTSRRLPSSREPCTRRDGAKVASGKSIGSLELVARPERAREGRRVSPPPPDTPTAQPTVGRLACRVLLRTRSPMMTWSRPGARDAANARAG